MTTFATIGPEWLGPDLRPRREREEGQVAWALAKTRREIEREEDRRFGRGLAKNQGRWEPSAAKA